jgi:UDP-N-acetylmuramoylalanine--D-glutamate ligase
VAADFQEALDLARGLTPAPGIILLSPGATSFDEFASFEERSAAFRAAAAAHPD